MPENKVENSESEPEPVPEELIRKTSRVVLHASERGRKSLFKTLTAKNADKIAEILKEKPIFYENKENAETKILLSPEIAQLMPPEFFENPTEWIEQQKNIERKYKHYTLPTGETIEELWREPYDVSKVKELNLVLPNGKKLDIVSKRIEPEETEEISLAVKAGEAGIPTPKVLGEIADKGNLYALFEKIEGIDLLIAEEKKKLSDLYYDVEKFLITEEESLALNNLPFKEFISKKAYKTLSRIWREAKTKALLKPAEIEIYKRLSSIILNENFFNIRQSFFGDLPENDVNMFFKKFGFKDSEDFIIVLKKIEKIKNSREVGGYTEFLFKKLEKMGKNSNIFFEKLTKVIYQDIFGIDIYKEKQKLEQMCEDKGIEHKDFADRNILIEWDFEKDEPKGKKEKDVKLYIIDWEAKSKSDKK